MSDPNHLTPDEARVLWSALVSTWIPAIGCNEWRSAMDKLARLGGGYRCRECVELGRHSSKLGGFLCDAHKRAESERWSSSRPDVEAAFRRAVVD